MSSSNILQAFRLGEKTWGIQFHPEFSKKIIREYIHERAVAIREEGLDPTKLYDQASNTPNSIVLFQKFCRLAMNTAKIVNSSRVNFIVYIDNSSRLGLFSWRPLTNTAGVPRTPDAVPPQIVSNFHYDFFRCDVEVKLLYV